MEPLTEFRPSQILYIEHDNTRLYAELIQVVAERGLCWVRPLAILTLAEQDEAVGLSYNPYETNKTKWVNLDQFTLYDLRQGSDLLAPQTLFSFALDTEVVAMLMQLNALKSSDSSYAPNSQDDQLARYHLQQFIRHIWQARPEIFQCQIPES